MAAPLQRQKQRSSNIASLKTKHCAFMTKPISPHHEMFICQGTGTLQPPSCSSEPQGTGTLQPPSCSSEPLGIGTLQPPSCSSEPQGTGTLQPPSCSSVPKLPTSTPLACYQTCTSVPKLPTSTPLACYQTCSHVALYGFDKMIHRHTT